MLRIGIDTGGTFTDVVTDTGQVRRVVDDAFKELGVIDVVVNNAG